MGHRQKEIGQDDQEAIARRANAALGKNHTEVELEVGTARQTVYTWKEFIDEGGIDALRSVPPRERPARVDESSRSQSPCISVPIQQGIDKMDN